MKAALSILLISINLAILLYLWISLGYASFGGQSLQSVLPSYEWWMFFMILDLWTWKFLRTETIKKPGI
jgi:hypothetical protein